MRKFSRAVRCSLGAALCAAAPAWSGWAATLSAQALLSPSVRHAEVADPLELWQRSAPSLPARSLAIFATLSPPAAAEAGNRAGVGGQAPVAGQGSTRQRSEKKQPPSSAGSPATLVVFEFHNGFWINLHHFLYHEAHQFRGEQRSSEQTANPQAGLKAEEQQTWKASLDYYAAHLADRDLLFNGDMVAIKNRLAEMEMEPDLRKSGLQPELEAALERAAPIYRAHWWAEQERANRAWVAAATPLVQRLGSALAEKLAAVYQAPWPVGRIRVDVSYYANPAGAYTTLEPLHITLSSSAEANQGLAAVEVLFHEASHALAGGVRDAIARECRSRNKPIPRDLWHALLFYTTGEIVRRAIGAPQGPPAKGPAAAGSPSNPYTPYAYRHGLYTRGWESYLRLLEEYWQPYLDGETDFDHAIARMAGAL